MRLTRTTLAAALATATLLTGCSDDGEKTSADPTDSTSSRDDSKDSAGAKTRNCKVAVELTGAIDASWEGKGRAITKNSSGPPAFYQAEDGDVQLAAYAEGNDFHPSAVVTSADGTFTTPVDATGLEISPKGTGAEVETDAKGVDSEGEGVHISATFDC